MVGVGLVAIVVVAVWVWALVDALRRPVDNWQRANQNQIVWVLVILLGNALGGVIYLLVARPQLEVAR